MNDSVKTRIYQRIGAFLFRRHQDEIAKRYTPTKTKKETKT